MWGVGFRGVTGATRLMLCSLVSLVPPDVPHPPTNPVSPKSRRCRVIPQKHEPVFVFGPVSWCSDCMCANCGLSSSFNTEEVFWGTGRCSSSVVEPQRYTRMLLSLLCRVTSGSLSLCSIRSSCITSQVYFLLSFPPYLVFFFKAAWPCCIREMQE